MNKITGIALIIALGLTGCGGGSGSAGISSIAPTSVSGNAAKGIVKNANVLVCRIINGVIGTGSSCASTTTGIDGSYSVTFSDGYTGPVMVTIQPGTSSTMLDETTGADIPYTLTMRAVASAVSATTTVYVTPFSEMAAASAVRATTMDANTISQAINAVQTLLTPLGIDLSVMPIVNLKSSSSDPATLTAQANMVAQLGNVVMAAKNSSSVTDANGVACNATSNSTSQQIACAVTAMENPAKSATMLAAMNAQNLTSISMPILQTNGTIVTSTIDMTSASTMQSTMQSALQGAGMTAALQNAGLAASGVASSQNIASAVASTATMMAGGMMKKP